MTEKGDIMNRSLIRMMMSGNIGAANLLLERNTGFVRTIVASMSDKNSEQFAELCHTARFGILLAAKQFNFNHQPEDTFLRFAREYVWGECSRVLMRKAILNDAFYHYPVSESDLAAADIDIATFIATPDTTRPFKMVEFAQRLLMEADLPPVQRDILWYYYGFEGGGTSFEQIGKRFAISPAHAKILHTQAIRKVQKYLASPQGQVFHVELTSGMASAKPQTHTDAFVRSRERSA